MCVSAVTCASTPRSWTAGGARVLVALGAAEELLLGLLDDVVLAVDQ
jgi:hypothetical protein